MALLALAEQALSIGFRQALLAPGRIFGGHDALDRAQAIVEPARRIVEVVEQFLVRPGQPRGGLPPRDVVEHQPRQADEDRHDRHHANDKISRFHSLSSPWPSLRLSWLP